MEPISEILITVNGDEYKVLNPKPDLYLSDWLRNNLHLTGVKTLCGEGGCGSCVVSVSDEDPAINPASIKAVNSCLVPVLSLDRHYVTTVEGLGGSKNGFHPIQKKFAEKFASQCGYCTSGFIMSGYSLLASNTKGLTKKEIEANLDGNICRCTGYRPILDAFKSFSKEETTIDIEDLVNSKRIKNCSKPAQKVIDHTKDIGSNAAWCKPTCLEDFFNLRKIFADDNAKLIVGNTGHAVMKDKKTFDAFIDLRCVKELNVIKREETGIMIGSAVTLTRIIEFLEREETQQSWYSAVTKHFKKIGSLSIRNVATWAGNLMLMHNQRNFSSDVYVVFETLGATLEIADVDGKTQSYNLEEFMDVDMSLKTIVSITLPPIKNDVCVKTYKIMPRKQNSYGYVCAGFRAAFDDESQIFKERPAIVVGGVGLKMVRVKELEEFLCGKCLDNSLFQESVKILEKHLEANPSNKIVDFGYCVSAAKNLFYKFCLKLRGTKACPRSLNSAGSFESPVTSGKQSFHKSDDEGLVHKPLERIEGKLQTSGQNKYVGDLPKYQTEVYASFVLAKQGNAELGEISVSEASKHPGFVGHFAAKDIPGTNNWLEGPLVDEIFVSKKIEYFGQPLGIIVADSQKHANEIARKVQVDYTDVQKPVTDLREAIEKKQFHPTRFPCIKTGDTQEAFKSCDHVVSGEIDVGSQHHFHIEPQTCLIVPETDSFTVFSASQCGRHVQSAVASALGINSSSVDVQVPRLGGAFGGKIHYPSKFAAAAAVACNALNRPVRMVMSLHENLSTVGKRAPFVTKYKVGFSNDGHLLACEVKIFGDFGRLANSGDAFLAAHIIDNAYHCPNWNIEIFECKTNTPFNTYVRAPGQMSGLYVIESIMDHIASTLGNKTSEDIKEINMYKLNQTTLHGNHISTFLLPDIWSSIKIKSNFEERSASIVEFNKANRWKKRGISLMPLKYEMAYFIFNFTAHISIYYNDGTVAITHGAVEMGQGVNTRVCQVAATQFGIPMELISVKPMSTITSPNSFETGGSISSELSCLSVYKCCEILLDRIRPIREKFPDKSWKELIAECGKATMSLSASHMFHAPEKMGYAYTGYGAACSEMEVDVLTGEYQLIRADLMYDCGESINQGLDVGQLEGAFVMGIGYLFTENILYDPESGRPLSTSTWNYKPPMPKDIPLDMRVYLRHEAPNPIGFVRSKAIGEPGVCFAASCVFALKRAIEAARSELGQSSGYFHLDCPLTVDKIQTSCKVTTDDLKI